MVMKRTLTITLFFLALALPALPAAAQDGTLLEGRLLRTRDQLGNGGSGLVGRYQRGVGRSGSGQNGDPRENT